MNTNNTNSGTGRFRMRMENMKYKLEVAFGAWLTGMLLICSILLGWQTHEGEYSTFSDAAAIHSCMTIHQFANSELPGLDTCNHFYKKAVEKETATANQVHINRSPAYSAALVLTLAAILL